MTVWQIGCGDAARRCEKLFLDHDVMLCGPGDFGPFDPSVYDSVARSGTYSSKTVGQVRAFATQVQPGDLVLLRSGHSVTTFGVVDSGGYAHLPAFDDVFGWDVTHAHRVTWQDQLIPQFSATQTTKGLFSGRKSVWTFTSVSDPAVLTPIRSLLGQAISRPLKPLPTEPSAMLTLDEFGDALFSRGLPYDSVDRVKAALRKQQRLLEWYGSLPQTLCRPQEHEVVAHVIVPLMLALGWSEQLLAVEWRKIDLAVFVGTPTDEQHCGLVCEAKRYGHGLQDANQQAEYYVAKRRLANCNRILLADGGRFYLRRKQNGVWEQHPSGYMNVAKLRTNHLYPPNTSAVDTLMSLTPANLGR